MSWNLRVDLNWFPCFVDCCEKWQNLHETCILVENNKPDLWFPDLSHSPFWTFLWCKGFKKHENSFKHGCCPFQMDWRSCFDSSAAKMGLLKWKAAVEPPRGGGWCAAADVLQQGRKECWYSLLSVFQHCYLITKCRYEKTFRLSSCSDLKSGVPSYFIWVICICDVILWWIHMTGWNNTRSSSAL